MDYFNVTVIIPALNPDYRLLNLVGELYENGFDDIVIVNDGSDDEHFKYFPDESKYPFCKVLHHRRNRGKGVALRNAFKFFNEHRKGRAGVVTIDCDGQHLTNDIKGILHMNRVLVGTGVPDGPFYFAASRTDCPGGQSLQKQNTPPFGGVLEKS